MNFRPIKAGAGPLPDYIRQTYMEAFPPAERRDLHLVSELIEQEPRFTLEEIRHEDRYAGLLSYWQFDTFAYIEHFAIDASGRNQGWGATALEQFAAHVHPLVLETEPPHDALSLRRIRFYQRAGFTLCPLPYLQPPYRKGDAWLPLCLMSYGDIDLGQNFDAIRRTLYQYVYGVAEN
ncbi:MAG: GNAT family N-acetyltransferase [Tannerellaceae bacterium]|nr:GNAT family N-acetyltransferase [Tannerellaceae bacterium]